MSKLKETLETLKNVALTIALVSIKYRSPLVMFNILLIPLEILRRFLSFKRRFIKILPLPIIFFVPRGFLVWHIKTGDEYFGLLRDIFLYRQYDVPLSKLETVVDVGAHVGFYTFYATRVLNAKHILALEPEYVNFKNLLTNIRLNRIHATCIPLALLRNGVATLFESSISIAHSVVKKTKKTVSIRKIHSISLETLARLSQKLFKAKRIDLMKLDIEGAELTVIEESPNLLKKHFIRSFVIDATDILHYHGAKGFRKIIKYLTETGYNIKLRKYSNNELILVAIFNEQINY